MNILVTGGSGFIGTRLVRELAAAGHGVKIFDLVPSAVFPELSTVGDVRDATALASAAQNQAAIIHLAAEHRDDPQSAASADAVNVGGTHNVVAAASQSGCQRIIFTSSVAVYPLDVPECSEDDLPQPYNSYGESKLKAEKALDDWARVTPGATAVAVRACVVFGEGNRGNVYNLLRQIYRRRFVMVGPGTNRKSMAYVGNLTAFLASCLCFKPGMHVFNYADKPDFSAARLVEFARQEMLHEGSKRDFRLPYWAGILGGLSFDVLSTITRKHYPVSAIRVRKFCAETTVSTRKLEQLGFCRPFALEEALKSTIRHEFY